MKEQKNLPVLRHRKRKKYQIWFRFFPHAALIAGCIAVIISITGNVSGKETTPDEIVSREIVSGKTIPESSVTRMDTPQNDTEPSETQHPALPWYLTLINSQNPLPENYMDHPIDLADVPYGEKVDRRIYEPLMEMLNAAAQLGPVVVSGYRTPEKQQSLYDDKIKEYKKQGYSENEAMELAQQ